MKAFSAHPRYVDENLSSHQHYSENKNFFIHQQHEIYINIITRVVEHAESTR